MFGKKKKKEPVCGNCLLYDRVKGQCRVAAVIAGEVYHMPVEPGDRCHMDELGVPVEQIRWFEEGGSVKVEYPESLLRGRTELL